MIVGASIKENLADSNTVYTRDTIYGSTPAAQVALKTMNRPALQFQRIGEGIQMVAQVYSDQEKIYSNILLNALGITVHFALLTVSENALLLLFSLCRRCLGLQYIDWLMVKRNQIDESLSDSSDTIVANAIPCVSHNRKKEYWCKWVVWTYW